MSTDDYNFEPRRGLPDKLPAGEKLLWQGSPKARAVASRIFKAEFIAVYFAVMMAWRFGAGVIDGRDFWQAAQSGLRMLPLAAAALVIVALVSLGVARTTVYSLTNRRIVMRIGIALPLTVNLPLSEIGNADLKLNADGSGDIALAPVDGIRLGYAVLWPHARPFFLRNPQPMLRCLAEPAKVADILAAALAVSSVAPRSVPAETAGADAPPRLAAAE